MDFSVEEEEYRACGMKESGSVGLKEPYARHSGRSLRAIFVNASGNDSSKDGMPPLRALRAD